MTRLPALAACVVLGVIVGRLTAPPQATAAPVSTNGDVNGDGTLDISDAVYLLRWLFLDGPAPEPIECPPVTWHGVPDTGIAGCLRVENGVGWVPDPTCDGWRCPGQDGAYATGCAWADRFVDNGDGTVTDGCTGLMWQRDAGDVNGDGQSTEDDAAPWCEALSWCENLSFAGADDWRLPSVVELQSIVDFSQFSPSLSSEFRSVDTEFIPGYWSSTPYLPRNDFTPDGYVWVIDFGGGDTHIWFSDADTAYVRAVRMARPGP